jgi:hypothetical protein
MRKEFINRLSKIENISNHKSKLSVVAFQSIIDSPKYLKGQNIKVLNDNSYIIINIILE